MGVQPSLKVFTFPYSATLFAPVFAAPLSPPPRTLASLIVFCLISLSGCEKAMRPSQSLEVAVVGLHSGALSDDGELFCVGSINHGGSLWRNASQERVYNWNHKENEYSTLISVDFSHDNKWTLTASPYDLVLWSTESGKGERFWSTPGEILDAELGPGANFALLGLDDHSAVIFDIRRGGILQTLHHQNRVRSVDLSLDGKLALTGSEDYTATLWNTANGEKLTTIKHDDDVQLVKLSPDGSLALSVSKYDKALLWQTDTGQGIGEIPLGEQEIKRGMRFTAAKFNSDNTLLLTGRPDEVVELWQLSDRTRLARWKLPKRDAWKPTGAAVIDIGFSAQEGNYFALASNGFLHKLQLPANKTEMNTTN